MGEGGWAHVTLQRIVRVGRGRHPRVDACRNIHTNCISELEETREWASAN